MKLKFVLIIIALDLLVYQVASQTIVVNAALKQNKSSIEQNLKYKKEIINDLFNRFTKSFSLTHIYPKSFRIFRNETNKPRTQEQISMFVKFLNELDKIKKENPISASLLSCKSLNHIYTKESHMFELLKSWSMESDIHKKTMLVNRFINVCRDFNFGLDKVFSDFKFFLTNDLKNGLKNCIKYDSLELKKWINDICVLRTSLTILLTACEAVVLNSSGFDSGLFKKDSDKILSYYENILIRKQFFNDNDEYGLVQAVKRMENDAANEHDFVYRLNKKYDFYNWTVMTYSDFSSDLLSIELYNENCGALYFKRQSCHRQNVVISWNLPNARFVNNSTELYSNWFSQSHSQIHNYLSHPKKNYSFIYSYDYNYHKTNCFAAAGNIQEFNRLCTKYYVNHLCCRSVDIGQCGLYEETIDSGLPSFQHNPIFIIMDVNNEYLNSIKKNIRVSGRNPRDKLGFADESFCWKKCDSDVNCFFASFDLRNGLCYTYDDSNLEMEKVNGWNSYFRD